jgi:hypothetical protein
MRLSTYHLLVKCDVAVGVTEFEINHQITTVPLPFILILSVIVASVELFTEFVQVV